MAVVDSRLSRSVRFKKLLQRLFPERQIHLRTKGRVSFIKLSRNAQIVCVLLSVVAFGWTSFATSRFVLHDSIIADKDNQIVNARLAYKSLLGEVSEYQKKFTSITRDIEENRGLMLGLIEQNTSFQQSLKTAKSRLSDAETEREKVIAAGEYLKRQLNDTEIAVRTVTDTNQSLKKNLDVAEAGLQTALSERNQILSKNNQMQRNIEELETRLASMQETEHDAVQRLTSGTVNFIESMQKVVQLTGLKVDKLLGADGPMIGQGGPFIAAAPDALPAGRLKADLTVLDGYLQRSEALQVVMRKLPLASPLSTYRITSTYGKRRDPINKKWATHYGLDLGAPFKSVVYSTAPGVVSFVGWNDNYGKMVEVDHGAGIKTRYAHLHKTLVSVGQKVNFRDNLGQVGNTGRSTGSHLHYEVIFRGKPRNPSMFIKAGRHVFKD